MECMHSGCTHTGSEEPARHAAVASLVEGCAVCACACCYAGMLAVLAACEQRDAAATGQRLPLREALRHAYRKASLRYVRTCCRHAPHAHVVHPHAHGGGPGMPARAVAAYVHLCTGWTDARLNGSGAGVYEAMGWGLPGRCIRGHRGMLTCMCLHVRACAGMQVAPGQAAGPHRAPLGPRAACSAACAGCGGVPVPERAVPTL